jgi:hypothetical protein
MYVPEITALPGNMQDMFKAAFIANSGEKRPTARDWYGALDELSGQLKSCTSNPGHMFYHNLSDCPWCKVNAQMTALSSGKPPFTQKPFNTHINPVVQAAVSAINIQGNPKATVAVWITGAVYGAGLGLATYWLLSFVTSMWGIVGGIFAGAMGWFAVAGQDRADNFKTNPGIRSFLSFLIYGLPFAVGGAISGILTFLVFVVAGSIIFGIIGMFL